jgi:hypothetical protein
MTFLNDCPQGRSQFLTFSRRELLQKAALSVLPFLTLSRQSGIKPEKYPVPPFSIGDKIASPWSDEDEVVGAEFGEIVGICWHPINLEWQYLINWTAGDCSAWAYPCFDETLMNGDTLRLVSHD